jgi:uncharacterized protein YmfQ (DUF2313 family)
MSANPYAALGADDFTSAAQNGLPTGDAWPREPNNLALLMSASAGRQAAVHAAATNLSELESDPRYTVVLLPIWEAAFGLPDPCLPADATIVQRQNALVARIAATGGMNGSDYIQLASSLGFDITITNFRSFVMGISMMGDSILGENVAFLWQVNAPEDGTMAYFIMGRSVMGEPLWVEQNAVLECVINREKPAHTQVIFNYEG